MKYIVSFSSGRGSWAAAKRTVALYGVDNTLLLSADTKWEDPDYYRFQADARRNIGNVEHVIIADGRTPWEVFRKERCIGNSRMDPCSKILKRELLDRWVNKHFTPETATMVVGIGWSEIHRMESIRPRLAPFSVIAPMCDPPYLDPKDIDAWMASEGLRRPAMYDAGFHHNNCGGRCVKQGQAGWKNLLDRFPERYAEVEAEEESMRQFLGKDVAMMKEQRDGQRRPLTLATFRRRIEAGGTCDLFDIGGCGCGV